MAGHLTQKSVVPNTDMKVKAGVSTAQAEVLTFIVRRPGLSVPIAAIELANEIPASRIRAVAGSLSRRITDWLEH